MVTIKEIAKVCGLSVTQVSRALNDHSDVSEKTKQIVREAAQKLGYVKNVYAANLVRQEFKQFMVIIEGLEGDLNEAVSSNIIRLLQGISTSASELGYEPLIYLKTRSNAVDFVDLCKSRCVSGAVVFGFNYDDSQYLALRNSAFPCVSVDIISESDSNGCVVVNNSFYAEQAVLQMLAEGSRRVACIAGFERSYVTLERLNGYNIALQTYGIQMDTDLVAYANFDERLAKNAMAGLLDRHPDIDAVFCMSDQMALGCIELLKERKIRIPKDVRVFGFDGMYLGNYTSPTLSTIEQDFFKKGHAAVRLLIDIIQQKGGERTIVIPCAVKVRQSSRQ